MNMDLLLNGFQLFVILAGVLVAWINIRKLRDSRGIDFIINAEGQVDDLHANLVDKDIPLIRRAFGGDIPDEYSDLEVRLYAYFFFKYSHYSRMYFLLGNRNLDLGLSEKNRNETIDAWMNEFRSFSKDPVMMKVHENAVKNMDFNQDFLQIAESYKTAHAKL